MTTEVKISRVYLKYLKEYIMEALRTALDLCPADPRRAELLKIIHNDLAKIQKLVDKE